jgi:mono/diheme cytochrome c family protein
MMPRLTLVGRAILFPGVVLLGTAPALAQSFESTVQPFLAKNCFVCHGAKLQSAGLNLETYQTSEAVLQDRDRWELVLSKLTNGQMPPKGMRQPEPSDVAAVTAWIRSAFERADKQIKPTPGHVTARRLNRAEYDNTVRDLLGVDIHAADDFPQDDSGYGFDNIGDVLSLSPVLMERYLAAAEKISKLAVFGPANMKPVLSRFQPPTRRRLEAAGDPVTIPPYYTLTDYDLTGLALPSALHVNYLFPAEGEYLFRCTVGNKRPTGSEAVKLAVWIDGKISATFDVIDNNNEGQSYEVRLRVARGDHQVAASFLKAFDGLPASYGLLNPSKRQLPAASPRPAPQAPPENATPEELADFKIRQANFANRPKKAEPADFIRMSWMEIEGPFDFDPNPSAESRRKIFVCGQHTPACEHTILSNLARHAFRRPPTQEELDAFAKLMATARQRGHSFDESLALAIQAMLVSPDFLFHIERTTAAASGAGDEGHFISQYELASRLSYFLWSTMPDDELMEVAQHGALRTPAVLEAQVRRMLKDPRADALAANFGGQWLEIRRLESIGKDRDRFPDFEDYLRTSMLRETELFFENVMRQDTSVLDFIDGKYTFLNERLALHYGIKDVKGAEFRKVDLTGTGRAGILTQASVLTVSSYPNRTSPVLRGKWILENLLNAPPPPPPPDVPNLDEAAVGATASLRQQMELHRANAVCASCHSRMDPLGFALENYDAIGAWRSQDGKFPIDASGSLPDGKTFSGALGLEEVLAASPKSFAQCISEKMLTYALGRGLQNYDRPAVNAIVDRLTANQYRFSALVTGIVESLPFQKEQKDRPAPASREVAQNVSKP